MIRDTELASFKEVWNVENCEVSLQRNNLHEAGGNLCWIDLQLSGSEIPVEDPSMQWLKHYADTVFVAEDTKTQHHVSGFP